MLRKDLQMEFYIKTELYLKGLQNYMILGLDGKVIKVGIKIWTR